MTCAELETNSPDETVRLGAAFGASLKGGECIALVGPLGAGKTHMVKGIAAGNSPDSGSNVTSPTFTLIHEYLGRLRIFHIDAYRLKTPRELAVLGFDEMLAAGGAVIVEWADKVAELIPPDALWIEIVSASATKRIFACRSNSPNFETLMGNLQAWNCREAKTM
jgi:tRNA threonylcarbamoyladenosine biosynthesis protein TsaE